MDAVNPIISDDLNEFLTDSFTVEEIRKAIKQMHPLKAPGPDGMPPLFFLKFWHIIACLDVLNRDRDIKEINYTLIELIPKVKEPSELTKLRPISLRNVIYKIIVKMIVNSFKRALPL